MFYPEEIVEEVRQRNDIVDVIGSYVRLQKKGSNYMGLCPFHGEKTASFSVSQNKQMYHCFGCGVGGNVFTFVMEYENYTFVEALKFLAGRAGIALPEGENSKEAGKRAELKMKLLEINKEAAKYFHYQLKQESGRHAMEYLKKRELSNETIVRFGLGYSLKYSDDLLKYMKNKGYSDELLKESGLFSFKENGSYDKFWNRAMFPIMDANSRVIGFGGRVMGEGEPKYLNSPETKVFDKSRNLYGLNFARHAKEKYFLLCEGYMDVIALHQAGFTSAVASLGTAFTSMQASIMKRYVSEVYLVYDSDGAGQKAALRAIPMLKNVGIGVKVVNMKPYKDPDEFIKALGAEEFQKRIDEAKGSFFYELDIMQSRYNLEDPEEKTEFFNEVAKKLTSFEEEIERNNYIEAVDRIYGIGFDNLRQLVNKFGNMLPKGESYDNYTGNASRSNRAKDKKEDGFAKAQKLLLTWLIDDVSLFPKVSKVILPDDFFMEPYHQVALMMYRQYEENGQVIPASIINHFESKEEQTEVASLFHAGLEEEMDDAQREKALNEIVTRIKKASIEHTAENEKDLLKYQELMKQREELNKLHIYL
ncbi:MAG: DNA primase [Lachnospiraceae bacterium]|nr:DNA primase [Lachnospiraceae bacterium]